MKAYRHWDDGIQWLRIITEHYEFDEPITGWHLSINLTTGETLWVHTDGRIIADY